jgi:4-oxalocrotonate tautomerase family enzyme
MAPEGIEAAARAGYDVQTTPLGAAHGVPKAQVDAFHRARAPAGRHPRLSLQRGLRLARDRADAADKLARAQAYYGSFDNVFGGPGLVDRGIIRPLPRAGTMEELGHNLLICGTSEMIDRLGLCRAGDRRRHRLVQLRPALGRDRRDDGTLCRRGDAAPCLPALSRLKEAAMPMIRIEMFEGRTVGQKRACAAAVTEAVVTTTGCAPQSVHIVFADVARSDWAIGWRLCSDPKECSAPIPSPATARPWC